MHKQLHSALPTLEAPGAGLPKLEAFMLRQLAMPMMGAFIPWRYAADRFQAEGRRILKLAEGQEPWRLTTPVLVPRLMAMEDSSRYWSVAMTLQHLILVGTALEDIIVTLGQRRVCSLHIDIAKVKPAPDTPATVVVEFRAFLPQFEARLRNDVIERRSRQTHLHPWVGQLTAQQWLCLAAVHQRLHRKQIQMILSHLQRTPS